MSSSQFVTGVLKWFDTTKGYGFVIYEDRDIFLHSKRLRDSGIVVLPESKDFNPGDKLQFKIQNGPKGAYATDITRI